MEGIGEILSEGFRFFLFFFVLVNLNILFFIGKVFSVFDENDIFVFLCLEKDRLWFFGSIFEFVFFLEDYCNDLEVLVICLCLEIGVVKIFFECEGSIFIRMLGLGLMCFGFFDFYVMVEVVVERF